MFSLKFVLRVNMQAGCRETCTLSVGGADGVSWGVGARWIPTHLSTLRLVSDRAFLTFRPLRVEIKELFSPSD